MPQSVQKNYYFFPTKEDLLFAVLDWYTQNIWPQVISPVFDRIDDPIERVFGVLDGYRQMLEGTQYMAGCPIGNLALELNETHPAARHILEQNFKAWRDVVRSALDGASDRLPEGVETEGLATFVLTTMEGAVILARTTGVSSPLTPQSRNSAITLTGCSPTEQPGRLRKKDQSTEEAQRDSSKKEE